MKKKPLYLTICWWADACIQFNKSAKLSDALEVNCTIGLKMPGTFKSKFGKRAYRYLQNAGSCSYVDIGHKVGYGEQDDFTDIPVGWVLKERRYKL